MAINTTAAFVFDEETTKIPTSTSPLSEEVEITSVDGTTPPAREVVSGLFVTLIALNFATRIFA